MIPRWTTDVPKNPDNMAKEEKEETNLCGASNQHILGQPQMQASQRDDGLQHTQLSCLLLMKQGRIPVDVGLLIVCGEAPDLMVLGHLVVDLKTKWKYILTLHSMRVKKQIAPLSKKDSSHLLSYGLQLLQKVQALIPPDI